MKLKDLICKIPEPYLTIQSVIDKRYYNNIYRSSIQNLEVVKYTYNPNRDTVIVLIDDPVLAYHRQIQS